MPVENGIDKATGKVMQINRFEFIERRCSNHPCANPLPPYLDLWLVGSSCEYSISFTCECGAVYELRSAGDGKTCWVMEGT